VSAWTYGTYDVGGRAARAAAQAFRTNEEGIKHFDPDAKLMVMEDASWPGSLLVLIEWSDEVRRDTWLGSPAAAEFEKTASHWAQTGAIRRVPRANRLRSLRIT
jgi:hypothetical protein